MILQVTAAEYCLITHALIVCEVRDDDKKATELRLKLNKQLFEYMKEVNYETVLERSSGEESGSLEGQPDEVAGSE